VTNSIQNIELNKNIGAVAPKLVIVNRVMGQSVVIVGVNWMEEFKIKNYWIIDGRMPEKKNEILIGSGIADYFELDKNRSIEIGAVLYEVAGVLKETGSDDDNVIFADISYLQSVSEKTDLVNFVEVSALCAGCPIEDIVTQISAKLPGTDIKALQNVVQQRMSAVDFVKRLAGGVSMVIMLTASFMIALFMFTSVNERKKEIGVLRSMGYSRLNVFAIFCFEALLIGVIAGILGYFSGFFASFKVLDILDMGEGLVIRFDFTRFAMTFMIVTVVSVVSSIIPALKAARVDPSKALISL
jgi:putative ABC transport system permease protein